MGTMVHHCIRRMRGVRDARVRLIGRGIVIGLCALACVVALSLHTERVSAANRSVTNCRDDGSAGSLRVVIGAAGSGDIVGFNQDCTGASAITLGSTLTLTQNVTIDGGMHSVTVDGNHAVQVFAINSAVTASISNLTIANGSAPNDFGGGIVNDGTLTVTNSTLSGNSAKFGGGIFNGSGPLTVTNSILSGNNSINGGGGILNGGPLTVTNSTFSGNSASLGGGISSGGPLTVTNSTFSGNTVTGDGGGGIANAGVTLTVTNSTLFGNNTTTDGGGILNFNGGTLNLTNTIVAGNTATRTGPDINGAVTTTDHNLIGSTSGSTGITNGMHGDIVNPTPHLDTLKDNGGTSPLPDGSHVKTVALLPGSPAIGAGDSSVCNSTTTPPGAPVSGKDQRGFPRPATTCAIGAFEPQVAPPTITLSPTTLPNATLETPYSQTITASGGTGPYTFAVTMGTLPPGLTLATNGTLSGTPTSTGSFTFTVTATATDHGGAMGNRTYTLVVPAPNPLPAPRPGTPPISGAKPLPAPRAHGVPVMQTPAPLPPRRP